MSRMLKKLNIILNIIAIIFLLLISISITELNILPGKYYYPMIGLLLIIGILFILSIFKSNKKFLLIISIISSIIISIISFLGLIYLNSTNKLLDNISFIKEKSIYYIIVKKDSDYKELSDLDNKNLAIIENSSSNYQKALKEVNKKININTIKYKNINTIASDLVTGKVDSILLNSNSKRILDDILKDFKNNTRVVDKVVIYVKRGKSTVINSNEPFNVLISGIDTAGDINSVSRSDVNIVMTVNPKNHEVLLTNIQRDMQVQLHGTTGIKDKLTHAGIYGIDMSRQTIEDFLDTKIPYYIRVNFDSLVKVVDSIGGVDIDNDVAFKGNTRNFEVGKLHLNGKEALEYARERKKMPSGDYTRGLHQEKIMEAIISKVTTSKKILNNYSKFTSVLDEFIQTNIPSSTIKFYVREQLDTMPKWNVISRAVESSGSALIETYSMPGMNLYVAFPDEKSVKTSSRIINEMLDNKKVDNK